MIKKPKIDYSFVSSPEDITALMDKGKKPKSLIVAGSLATYSEQGAIAEPGFELQPERARRRGLLNRKGRLSVAISKELLRLAGMHKFSITLGFDYWLKQALKVKKTSLLFIGGIPGGDETVLTILQVDRGTVTSIVERVLPAGGSLKFHPEAIQLVERMRQEHPETPIFWAEPLPSLDLPFVTEVSLAIYQTSVPVIRIESFSSTLAKQAVPLLLLAAGASAYGGLMYYDYSRFKTASEQFRDESAALQGDYKYASDRLTLMEERKKFIEGAKAKAKRIAVMEMAMMACAEADLRLREMTVQVGPKLPNVMTPDLDFTVEVTKDGRVSAIEQSGPVLAKLSGRLGMRLRLAQNGYKDFEAASGGSMRSFRIEGDLGETK